MMNSKAEIAPGGVVFVFDRVMHYHAATMRAIERRLEERGVSFTILSAQDAESATGRVALREPVARRQRHFRLSERKVGRFMIRVQHDIVDLLKELRPSVVVSTCHSGTLSEWRFLRWARRNQVRRVAWQCGYEYNPSAIKRFALNRFVPLFNYHLCYHSNARDYALQYGASPDQVTVMHNTIDESKIFSMDKAQAKSAIVARWPSLAGKKIVLYVGAVLEEKRLDDVFEAMKLLNDDSVAFVLVGNGPYLPVLLSRYAGRIDWVSTGSVVTGVGEYFDAADVFVLPGTGGLAINEAMAHQLPVISGYADGSADDLVDDGETGFRLRSGKPKELAERIRDVLANPDRAASMGAKGEERIRGPLSFEAFIDRVVGVLLEQHRQAERRV